MARPGRPTFEPTEAQRESVSVLSACGTRHETIAQMVINPETGSPIHVQTLKSAFKHELENGREITNGKVAQSLFAKAIGDGPQSVAACIFYLKTRARWRETDPSEDFDPQQLAADVQNAIRQALATTTH